MSQTYVEPMKFSAGALALLVHGLFFSLLFFGFNWRVIPQTPMVVEMWDKLPDIPPEIAPTPAPLPEPVIIPPAVPPKIAPAPIESKADIEFKAKKKKQPEKKPLEISKLTPSEKSVKLQLEKQLSQATEAAKQKELTDQAELEKAKLLAEQQELQNIRRQAEQQEREKQRLTAAKTARETERIQELKEKMRAEMDAATQTEVARFKDMIRAKISRNIIMPPDVAENAEAKFLVIVLPGGTVVDVKMLKSSGNSSYDTAAERAIYKAQPLPMPQDSSIARMFRELQLSVKP